MILAKAAVFIAVANSEAYWSFVDDLKKVQKLPIFLEEIQKYSLSFLTEELRSLLELSLLTREYSPRIEIFCQLLSEYSIDQNSVCAIFQNSVFVDSKELASAIDHGGKFRPKIFPFDPRSGIQRDMVIIYLQFLTIYFMSGFLFKIEI
jgi:hypothetical protein